MLKNNSMFRLTAVVVLVAMLLTTACVTGMSFDDVQQRSGGISIDTGSIEDNAVDHILGAIHHQVDHIGGDNGNHPLGTFLNDVADSGENQQVILTLIKAQ